MAFGNDPRHSRCDHCGGDHDNVPLVDPTVVSGELTATCPHCGEQKGLGVYRQEDLETHQSTPEGEPATHLCPECNGSYEVETA